MKAILLSLFLVCSVASEKKVPDVLEDVQQSISLYPPVLDFGFSAVGRAKSKLVTLINKHSKKSVQLNKISGKTLDFYSSFFDDKIVPGGGNTTFNVIFLPRSFGEVKTNLLIHTSFGDVKLPIKGQGKECPYRLRPSLVGIKAPLNATITPEIVMYNPHSTPIQILEVYSSGGQFQLELPSGGQEGPQALWEIPPYTSKPIIRIRFHGAQVGNHTAYIRIKISKWSEAEDPDGYGNQRLSGSREENILVVPVEFEILSSYGIYSRMPIIDFGITTTNDEAKMIRLNLLNSGNEHIDIIDLKLKNVAGLIELQRSDLTLILNSKQATENLIINGEVVIKTQKKKFITEYMELSVGIQAEIFKGSLDFAGNTTVFITGAKNYTRTKREFFAKNSFTVPLSISNLAIEKNDTTVFNLTDFRPVILKPNAKIVLFSIAAVNETANFKSRLTIETNITSYKLSIVICTGLLTRFTSLESAKFSPSPDDNVLDFGAIPSGDFSNFGFILMKNLNPIPIQLQKWNFSNPSGVFFNSMFLGCAPIASVLENGNSEDNRNGDKVNNSHDSNTGDEEENNVNINDSRFKFYFTLSPDNFGAFELSVQAYSIKSFTAVFTIWTEIEEIVTSVKFITVMGSLRIDSSKLHFKECFPGRRCSADILIHSTFLKTMRVKAITVSVPGLIFEYNTVSPNGLPEIIANQDTAIGKIHFDPTSVCGKNCYVGKDDQLSNTNNNKKNIEFDKTELRERAENFRRLKWNLQSITFTLETTEVRRFEFNASVDIVWPKLVKGIQTLPPVEVGQNYDAMILLKNPSNHHLNVDIYLSDPKEAKATNLSLPLEVVDICMFCYLTDRKVFLLNGKPSDYHYTQKIKPNSIIKIPVRFIGKEAGTFSTLMHIRNNLTIYEAVWITAKAVQPQFRFGNRKPGSNTPLLFEIIEKHLTSCDKTKTDDDTPVLVSSKRTFTARNMGEIPIFIKKFYIGDEECEGYGFKILDCSSFELKGNSSKKIDIAFTPDFTMTRISQTLYLKTNLSYSNFNYTLLATVPASCLEQCTKALMRPFWETYMKMMSVGVLAVAFIFVLISAFLDSDKVLKDHVQNMSKEKGPIQPPLDLRRIVGLSKSDSVQDNGSGSNSTDKNNAKSNGTSLSKKRNAKRNTISNVAPIANSNNNSNNSNHKNKLWGEDFTKKINSTLKLANNLTTLTNRNSNSQSNDQSSHQNHRINQPFSQRSVKEEKPQKKTPSKDFTDHGNSENAERFELLEKMSEDVTQKKTNSRMDGSSLDAKKTKLTLRKTKSLQTTTCDSSSHLNAAKDEMNLIATIERNQDKMSKLKYQREKSEQPITDKKNLSSNASELSFSSSQSNESCSKNTLENKSLKLANGLRKYGKTPGRERKKETNQSTKRLERKAPKFKGTAFQFSSPIVDDKKSTISPSANSSIWDQSQASFSNIVAQTINSSDQLIPDFHNINNNEMYQNSSAENCGNLQHDWNEADLKNHETFGLDDVTKLPDLGPIGTKKSPSSTPIWEPLQNSIHRPTANTSFSSMSANSSFFSNSFPTRPCLEYANDNQYLGGASGLLDHLVLDSQQQQSQPNPQHLQHSQQNWQTNDFLLSLLQQRDQRNASATRQHIDWPTNRPVWAPVVFPETPNTNLNIWPNSSVRPPPGLGITRKESPIRNQQPVHTQPQNLLHPQPNKEQNNEIDEIPTFDPFSSLSSIWSDSWNNSNTNNNKKQ